MVRFHMYLAATIATAVIGLAHSASAAPQPDADAAQAVDTSASSDAASGTTVAQRERLAEKLRLIDQIMRVAQQAGNGRGAMTTEQRRWMLDALYMTPLEEIRAMGVPGDVNSVTAAIATAQKTELKSLGSSTTDLVYRPITPCRYIDTRAKPPAVGFTPFSVNLGLTGASYGGSASCNPVTAAQVSGASDFAAISMNVGIVNPQFQPGFLGARPAGSSNSTSLVNWYQSGPTVQASNAGVITTGGGGIEFFGTPTDLVVDVLGVFTRPDATALDCTTVVQDGVGTNNVPTGSVFNDFGSAPVCPNNSYSIVSVGCEYGPTPPAGLELSSSAGDPSAGFFACVWFNNSGMTLSKSSFHVSSRCCRTPGR